MPELKRCTKCTREKDREAFARDRKRPDGLQPHCRECQREAKASEKARDPDRWKANCNRRARKWARQNPLRADLAGIRANMKPYGLTVEDYFSMVERQDGVCAICSNPPESCGRIRLHVDHCHKTGIVRGLLCMFCNTALGKFGDSETLLGNAISYLKSNEPCPN